MKLVPEGKKIFQGYPQGFCLDFVEESGTDSKRFRGNEMERGAANTLDHLFTSEES